MKQRTIALAPLSPALAPPAHAPLLGRMAWATHLARQRRVGFGLLLAFGIAARGCCGERGAAGDGARRTAGRRRRSGAEPGRRTITLVVENGADRRSRSARTTTSPRPTARSLRPRRARGMRLNIASGTAVRFEPGQQRTVELVDYAGERAGAVYGFRGLVQGAAVMATIGAPTPRCSAPPSATASAWPTPTWSSRSKDDDPAPPAATARR